MKLIDQFIAKADGGATYTVLCYQDQIPTGSHDDANSTIPGLKRFVTSDDQALNFRDANTFQIVATGETIRRVDARSSRT